jgi:hypothetical protein
VQEVDITNVVFAHEELFYMVIKANSEAPKKALPVQPCHPERAHKLRLRNVVGGIATPRDCAQRQSEWRHGSRKRTRL